MVSEASKGFSILWKLEEGRERWRNSEFDKRLKTNLASASSTTVSFLRSLEVNLFSKFHILYFIVSYLSIFLYLRLIYSFLPAPLQGQRNVQGRKNPSRLKEEEKKRVNVNKNKLQPLTSTHSLLNPSRLHLQNILEIHGFFFCLHTKKQPRINLLGVMWCHFLHSALKPLVIRNSSARDSHYLQTVGLHLYLFF